jgi:hypothetical protein
MRNNRFSALHHRTIYKNFVQPGSNDLICNLCPLKVTNKDVENPKPSLAKQTIVIAKSKSLS